MVLQLNDIAPDFEAETTEGKIRFHDWIGDKWVVLFSHPKDFTPVCTTELGYMAKIKPEFDRRGVKIIGLSVDPIDRHAGWASDIKETQGHAPNYPMIEIPISTCQSFMECCQRQSQGIPPSGRPRTIRRCGTSSWSGRTRRSNSSSFIP